jgi:hypothetical protein
LQYDRPIAIDEHAPLDKCLDRTRERNAFDVASDGQQPLRTM